MKELDPESQHIREVYARYGLAMYQAQCLERQIAILLTTVYGPGPKQITRSQYDKLLDSYFKRTLGRLHQELNKSSPLPKDFDTKVKKAITKRNWLAHSFFWERAFHFMSDKGRSQMLEELQGAIDFFQELDAELSKIGDEWAKLNGVTAKQFEKAMERLANSTKKELNKPLGN